MTLAVVANTGLEKHHGWACLKYVKHHKHIYPEDNFIHSRLCCSVLFSPGLTICGHNCLLTAEWMSASKIVCRVGQAKNDKGDIIVTTKSGGKGTSTVSFKLLKPEKIGIVQTQNYFIC